MNKSLWRHFGLLAVVVSAYVVAKFPGPDEPVWNDPNPPLRPIAPGRPTLQA